MNLPVVKEQTPRINIFNNDSAIETSDIIIQEWKEKRKIILEDICDEQISLLTSNNCMSNSLRSDNRFMKNETCKGCQIIKSFIEEFYLDSNKEIKIMSGLYKGDKLKMYSHKDITIDIFKNDILTYTLKTSKEYISIKNPFLNYVIVSCIMEKLLENKKYPSYVPYLWSYICNDTFNIIINIKHMKTLKEISLNPVLSKNSPLAKKTVHNTLNEKIVRDIFMQLTLICYFYGKYHFSHGEPSINYINFSPMNANFIFQEIKVNSRVTLVLCPSTKSSITYKEKVYHQYRDKKIYLDEPIESKDVGLDNRAYTGNYESHRILYYKIGNQADKFLNLNYTGGYSFFESFDYVMFLSSLIADNSFYESFKENNKMMYIWKSLWKRDEYNNLFKELSQVKRNNFHNVFSIVKKYHIRTDALKFSMACLYDL